MIEPLAVTKRRTSALLQLQAGDVACTLQVRDPDRGQKGATYGLLLANEAIGEVSCRLYGIDDRKRTREFGQLVVAGRSAGSSIFATPEGALSCKRLYVEVLGRDMCLLGEAIVPRASRPAVAWQFLTLLCLLFLGSLVIASIFVAQKPAIHALVVPSSVNPGSVRIPYVFSDRTTGRYRAITSDGRLLSSDVLATSSGALTLVLSDRDVGSRVHLVVEATGATGSVSRSADFDVVATPIPIAIRAPLARIVSLSARREVDAEKTSVLASYLATGDGGMIRVLDTYGTEIGRAPFSHVGTTRIALTGDARGHALRAILDVTRAGSRTSSSVELPADVMPTPPPTLAAAVAISPTVPANEAISNDAAFASPGDPFAVVERVVAGRLFTVSIRHPLPNMRIALQDAMGTTLDERSISAGASSIAFTAPRSTIVETYYLSCTYERASGQESLIRSLRIFPN